MKQNQPTAAAAAAAPSAAPARPAKPRAPDSSLAAAFDRVAQKSGFDNWKQLDREQPLPTRSTAPVRASVDPDAKPEPPKLSGKLQASGQNAADVSFADFVKGTQRLPSANRRG